MDEKTKRKTTTSSAVKNRYNAKAYKRYAVSFKVAEESDIIQLIEEKKSHGLSASEAIKQLIRE